MVNKIEVNKLGIHYGKRDLDRVGYFDDNTVGDFGEYKNVSNLYKNKGKQFIAGQPNDYFDKKYKRLFEGEYSNKQQNDKTKKKIDNRWIVPTSPTKLHSTPDDWFGCFGKPVSYFSPAIKTENINKNKKPLPNFKTKPSPLGGPGYVDITLNPYPKHSPEPYIDKSKIQKKENKGKFLTSIRGADYFTLNPYAELQPGPTYIHPSDKKFTTIGTKRLYVPFPKKPGGMHDGCFNKFPEYFNSTYQNKKQDKHDFVGKFILGGLNSKSKYTFSIIDRVTKVSCNANNFLGYQPRVYPILK